MSEHFNTPERVGYSHLHKEIYKKWLDRDRSKNTTIFAGKLQADLFFFAMAIGVNRGMNKKVVGRNTKDIHTNVFKNQIWGILASEIANKKNLLILKDEKKIYEEAEKYAEEGIKIITSHMDKQGPNYPKYLEAELREILKKM